MMWKRKRKTDFQEWESFLASQHIQFVVIAWDKLPSASRTVIKLIGENQNLTTYGTKIVFTVGDKFFHICDAR